jgi:PAS domain S-box-containing protein
METPTLNILAVEDDEAHAVLIGRAFSTPPGRFRLTVARSLGEARRYLTQSRPDLVLADLRLPDGRGTELLPAPGEQPSFPVVVITAHGSEQVAVEAIKAGALDYVVKSASMVTDLPRVAERALREWNHIGERHRMQEALNESRARFADIIAHAMDAVIAIDEEQRIVIFNAAAERIFGWTAAAAMGQPISRLIPQRYHVAHAEHLHKFAETDAATRAMRGAREIVGMRADGREFAAEASILKVDSGGKKLLAVMLRDITERKRAESLNQGQNRVLEMIAGKAPLNDTLAELMRVIENQAEGMLCSVLLLGKDGGHLYHGAAPSLPQEYNRLVEGHQIGPQAGSCGTAAYRREPVFVTDIRTDPLWAPYREIATRFGLGACWSTPIFSHENKLLGTFAIYYRQPRSPTETETRLIKIATHIAGIAIERQQAEQELQQRAEEFAALYAASQHLAVPLDVPALLEEIATRAAELLNAPSVGVLLYDKAQDNLELVFTRGTKPPVPLGTRISLNEGITGRTAQSRQAMIINDYEAWEHRVTRFGHIGIKSVVEAPMLFAGELIGVLGVSDFHMKHNFTETDAHLLMLFAAQAAAAVRNTRLREEAQQRAEQLAASEAALRRSEQEVQRMNAELEQRVADRTVQLKAANEELEAFSYSVSHDLRAPLRSIDGFTQVLLEDCGERLNAESRESLDRVRKAGQRMERIVDGLLTLARVARDEVHFTTVDLSALAHAIAGELQAGQPGRQAQFIIAPGLTINADPDLMHIALENLLRNAWKFTGRSPAVRIELGVMQRDRDDVYFVRDNGAGFDMNFANKLFRPFQRLHHMSEFEGTGVGLATVSRIIRRHGGQVWAEGATGNGATFFFTVPSVAEELSKLA